MPILLLLIQILVSDADFCASVADVDAYHTDSVASDTNISAYAADVAIFILHLLLYCSFSSSVLDSAIAAAGTISLIGGWPCTALRAQSKQIVYLGSFDVWPKKLYRVYDGDDEGDGGPDGGGDDDDDDAENTGV